MGKKYDSDIVGWITRGGKRIPIRKGEGHAIGKSKPKEEKGSNAGISEYGLQHRPGSPIDYPDEVATVDKIRNGQFFPDDILDHPELYFADYGNYGDEASVISTLKKAQANPDLEVTIYRGAPSGGVLNTGDWVTLSKKYADTYAGDGIYSDNKNSKVYSYKVKAKDLSFDGDSIYEFGYWGKKLK